MKDYKRKGVQNSRSVLLKKVRKKVLSRERRRNILRRVFHRVIVVLQAVFLLALLVMGGRLLMTSPFFEVRGIEITGNRHLQGERLRRYEARLRRNIFLLDLASIREDLLSEPYVRKVWIRRQLPDRVRIRIEERIPFARLRMGKKEFLIDREGTRLEEIHGDHDGMLPLIRVERSMKDPGCRGLLSEALALLATIRNYGYPDLGRIRDMELTPIRGAVLHPRSGEFEIVCGSGDFLQKLILLKRVVADLAERKWPVRAIDLRFRDQVVIRTDRPVRVL